MPDNDYHIRLPDFMTALRVLSARRTEAEAILR
jgi:hypothetical protein